MDAAVINTLNKSEWVVELSYRHSHGHIMSYHVCDDVAWILRLKADVYCKAAEKYGANLIKTAIYHLIPKKDHMVFDSQDAAAKFKEEWIEPQLMSLQLANIIKEM